jgi:cysteine desulfurase
MNNIIYLDNHATTKVDPEVLEEMLPYFSEIYGNPSSRLHNYGWMAEQAIEKAREQVARLINAKPYEIIFTSGATESNNTILKCTDCETIITSTIEHNSIIKTCESLQNNKNIIKINVNENGIINLNEIKECDNCLVSIMMANNETGVIQPISKLKKIYNFKIHSDMAQCLGKIPINVNDLDIDYASLSSHKIYGPKGCGAMYIKDGNFTTPLIHGGGHESGLRAGTHNVPAIVGFGKACEMAQERMSVDYYRIKYLKIRLYYKLKEMIQGIKFHGNVDGTLPGCLNFYVPCKDPDVFISSLNANVAISFGSACLTLSNSLSHVLIAMGVPEDEIKRTIRVSIGKFNTEEEIDLTANFISKAIKESEI